MESMGSGPRFLWRLESIYPESAVPYDKKNARLQTCSQTGVLEFTWLLAAGCWD